MGLVGLLHSVTRGLGIGVVEKSKFRVWVARKAQIDCLFAVLFCHQTVCMVWF